MSTEAANDNIFAEFTEDYFAECEEHLTIVRRDLLALEDFVDRDEVDRSLLEELFRSFHSLKGMSGMIGLKEAEQLAHELESYLRAIREQEVVLSPPGIEALIAGTKMLEEVIANYRTHDTLPDIAPVLQEIRAVVPESAVALALQAREHEEAAANDSAPPHPRTDFTSASGSPLSKGGGGGIERERTPSPSGDTAQSEFHPSPLNAEEKARLVVALQGGKKAWRFEFAPVPDIAARGINVTKIRDRLQATGELIYSSPRVVATGGIVFDFVIATDAPESTFADWVNDGLTYTPYTEKKKAPTPEGEKGRTYGIESENTESSPSDDEWLPLTLNHLETARLLTAFKGGKKAWRFKFTPGAGLAQKGLNVTKIRDRLQATGELIYSSPRVLATGGIVFDFLIATDTPESTFATWVNDGLTYIPYVPTVLVEEAAPVEPSIPVAVSPEKKQVCATTVLAVENGSRGSGTPQTLVTPDAKTVTPDAKTVVPTAGRGGVSPAVPAAAPSNMVRVDLARLDELMRMVGDLVISRARLEDNLSKLETIVPAPQLRVLRETSMTLSSQLRDLREGVMQVRLVPIREIFARMQFVVRDIARESHKKVTLELIGQETEIDKFVVERMMDPLLHLVRNAVSHGLEPESERIDLGKSPVGKLALRAATVGETVVIEIEDDGRGVDLERVTARARSLGLIGADGALDMNAALDVICSAGFSTREVADLTSGRGVGMAVVKTTVQELGGTLALDSELGVGARFTIQLPLTLAIADALIVRVGGQTFAVPLSAVREVFHVESAQVTVLENNEIIAYRDGVLPLLRLERLFKLSEAESTRQVVLVVGNGLAACGVVVERILDQREIVVRTLRDPLVQVVGISGATELGDGRVVLILDAAALPNFPKQHSRSHKNLRKKSAKSLVGNGQLRSGALE